MPRAPRQRLPADQARLRILDAAERRLNEVGPEGFRLAELARELGVSHPAILHHFGSREELVQAVVSRAVSALNAELIDTFTTMMRSDPRTLNPEELLARIAETLADRGQARLIAWLTLSGREPEPASDARLERVIAAAHAFRSVRAERPDLDLADTVFFVQLTVFALLGDALFGDRMRSFGAPTLSPALFRARLGELLELQIDRLRAERKS